ncbi:HDIG domain-containing metalloprotein [Candidatus Endomicrobiellum trichonymphae]|uniref:HDIG domain-containing metalloprotein n=1 Tax=Endomicrobium trichonymphae TaxID=1408204 RepID=UPI0018D502F1
MISAKISESSPQSSISLIKAAEFFTDKQKHFDNNATFSENITRESLLKFAALFHDSAKPETAKFENGKMHFLGHEELGAGKVKEIMFSLKSSKNDMLFKIFKVL